MSTYCTISDVYSWLPRGAAQRPARDACVGTGTDTITLDDHGFTAGDTLTCRNVGGTLPGGIAAGTTYYALVLTPSTFQISLSPGGAVVDLVPPPCDVLVIAALPWAAWIEEESASLDCTVPAHVVPFDTTPAIVRKYVAAMVAHRVGIATGVPNVALDTELRDHIRPELAVWRKGASIRGSSEPSSAQTPQLYTPATTASTRTIL